MSVHHVHGPTVIAGCCNVIIVDGTPIAAVLAGEAIANDLPFGAVVAIATLADCVPMVERDTGINIARYVYLLDDEVLHVNQTRSPRVTEMSDQLPYGDFRPGAALQAALAAEALGGAA